MGGSLPKNIFFIFFYRFHDLTHVKTFISMQNIENLYRWDNYTLTELKNTAFCS